MYTDNSKKQKHTLLFQLTVPVLEQMYSNLILNALQ